MVTSVSTVPKNNREKAYFGECSYIRLVCENCANLLICNVQKGSKPCFLSLFNDLAKKQGEKKEEAATTNDNDGRSNSKKRRSDDLDNEPAEADSTLTEMKRLLEKCMIKLNNVENATTKNIAKQLNDIENAQKSMVVKLQSNNHALEEINSKIDRNLSSIDDCKKASINWLK